jgi:DNA-binding transcriptional LysR family regulator
MTGPTTDQIVVFLAIVDCGSFASAAKSLGRAQSAVTYAIKRLEEQVGSELFDRGEYRPVLTEAGRALLPGARRIAEAMAAFRARAHSLAEGQEAEVSVVVDCIFPMQRVSDALRAFNHAFPAVPVQLYVESYVRAADLLTDGTCAIGVLSEESCAGAKAPLTVRAAGAVELILVVAASHPLAKAPSPIAVEDLNNHIRLVLGNRPEASQSAEMGRFYGALWFVSDVAAKRDLLLMGLGWGLMPTHMVADDVAAGRLVRVQPEKSDYLPFNSSPRGGHVLNMYCACKADRSLGPAAVWLLDYFS